MRKVRKLLRLFISNQKGESIAFHKDHRTKLLCHWLSGLEYKTHMLNWVECNEEVSVKNQGVIKGQRFVHITDMELSILYAYFKSGLNESVLVMSCSVNQENTNL